MYIENGCSLLIASVFYLLYNTNIKFDFGKLNIEQRSCRGGAYEKTINCSRLSK